MQTQAAPVSRPGLASWTPTPPSAQCSTSRQHSALWDKLHIWSGAGQCRDNSISQYLRLCHYIKNSHNRNRFHCSYISLIKLTKYTNRKDSCSEIINGLLLEPNTAVVVAEVVISAGPAGNQ